MDWYPDFDDVWGGGLMWEHTIGEHHNTEEDDGVLGEDPFSEGGGLFEEGLNY